MFKITTRDQRATVGNDTEFELKIVEYQHEPGEYFLEFNYTEIAQSKDISKLYRLKEIINAKHEEYLNHLVKCEEFNVGDVWDEICLDVVLEREKDEFSQFCKDTLDTLDEVDR